MHLCGPPNARVSDVAFFRPAHHSQCTAVNGEVKGTGTGPQKHVARDMAAKAALEVLQG